MSVININLFSMMLRRTIDVTVVLPDKINGWRKASLRMALPRRKR